jgi:hypothetical protein
METIRYIEVMFDKFSVDKIGILVIYSYNIINIVIIYAREANK